MEAGSSGRQVLHLHFEDTLIGDLSHGQMELLVLTVSDDRDSAKLAINKPAQGICQLSADWRPNVIEVIQADACIEDIFPLADGFERRFFSQIVSSRSHPRSLLQMS